MTTMKAFFYTVNLLLSGLQVNLWGKITASWLLPQNSKLVLITAKNTVVNGLFSTSLLGKLKPLPAITAN